MAVALFLLFLFLKQFYFMPSGSIGIADIALALCFMVLLGERTRRGGKYKSWSKAFETRGGYGELPFCFFIFCAIMIDGIYVFFEESDDFLRHGLFWLYNGMAVWCFESLVRKPGFKRRVSGVLKINISVQTVIWFSGRGRLFYEPFGGTRYMGTFNDPNQLAFFMFLMILLLYLCEKEKRGWDRLIFYILAMAVITASKSAGVSLGLLVFIVCAGTQWIGRHWTSCKSFRMFQWIACIGLLAITLSAGYFMLSQDDFSVTAERFSLLGRIQEKLWKMRQGGFFEIFNDRGWNKLFLYPEYLLYGAGEGDFARFSPVEQANEIHSSLFSILFCYGVFPASFLLLWLKGKMRHMNSWMWPAVLALLTESFFLINYRQPLFWLVFIECNRPFEYARASVYSSLSDKASETV